MSSTKPSKPAPKPFAPEVRERDHQADYETQWAAITSIAEKIGCSAETLRGWVRRAERDAGQRPGLTTDERARLAALERENKELKRANEILRKASAYFALAELDRPTR
jgi:transposase-like protein